MNYQNQQEHENLNTSLQNLKLNKAKVNYGGKKNQTKDGLDSYYAINAPAPGTVGVASAIAHKSYKPTGTPDSFQGYGKPAVPTPTYQYYANSRETSNRAVPIQHNIALQPESASGTAIYANVQPVYAASNYTSYGNDADFPPPPPLPEDNRPPPSPVSSSYAELRTTHHRKEPQITPAQSHVPIYPAMSQTSSTYESIYEPVGGHHNSSISSDMSSVKGYHGPYASPMAKGLVPAPSNQPIMNPDKVGKEAEVDALTNLLVQSMDRSSDPEFFGICSRCGDRVLGEGAGCTAMEQVFHIQCFCCVVCLLKLQGKPFYALDSKPYCENCYLNTLEKCSVCTQPILDRILRATGKPYHPKCFTCVVCNKSLDGIPFTVDASNQIHCIEDFHKKFAPRCTVCAEPIMPEHGKDETVRVVALDRSFHVSCYKCEDCGLVLSSEAEGKGCYPLDNHVLCKSCNARRVRALTSKVTTEL